MRIVLALAAIALVAPPSVADAAPQPVATAVATKLQLRGHLQELGETPTMRVFLTAEAYDSYHRSLGAADIFPSSSSLFMSFDAEILALYTRGNDIGGRCLRTGANASLDADTVTLDLSFESGTCGAPASAHYPFILVSVSRMSAGSGWIGPGRQVCAAPAGSGNACASVVPGGPSPSPTPRPTGSPSPTPAPTPTASIASPPATSPPVPSATTTPAASPTRSPVAVASPTPPPDAGGGIDLFYLGSLVLGFVIGALVIGGVMSARSASRARRRD